MVYTAGSSVVTAGKAEAVQRTCAQNFNVETNTDASQEQGSECSIVTDNFVDAPRLTSAFSLCSSAVGSVGVSPAKESISGSLAASLFHIVGEHYSGSFMLLPYMFRRGMPLAAVDCTCRCLGLSSYQPGLAPLLHLFLRIGPRYLVLWGLQRVQAEPSHFDQHAEWTLNLMCA